MTEKRGWLGRLAAGLKRTSSRLSEGIAGIFVKRRLDKETLAELEDLLIAADLGPATAAKLVEELRPRPPRQGDRRAGDPRDPGQAPSPSCWSPWPSP